MVMSFVEYFASSFKGLSINELFMGILLGTIVADLASLKNYLLDKLEVSTQYKVIWTILFYIFAIPLGLIMFTLVIFLLWIISHITG